MAGRRVQVPDAIRRIYVAHDPPAIFLTALAPDLMIGTPFARSPAADALLPPAVRRLPVIGGGARINLERLLARAPDVGDHLEHARPARPNRRADGGVTDCRL